MQTGSEIIQAPRKGARCKRITLDDLGNFNAFVRDNAAVLPDQGMLDNIYLLEQDSPTYGEVRARIDADPVLRKKYALGEDTPLETEDVVYALRSTRFWEVTPEDLLNYYKMQYFGDKLRPHVRKIWTPILTSYNCHLYMMYYDRNEDLSKAVGCGKLKPPRLCPPCVIPFKWASAFLEDGGHRMRYWGPEGGEHWRDIEHAYPSPGYPTWPEQHVSPNVYGGRPYIKEVTTKPEQASREIDLPLEGLISDEQQVLYSPAFVMIYNGAQIGSGFLSGFKPVKIRGEHIRDSNLFTIYPGSKASPQWSIQWKHSQHQNARVIAFARYSVGAYSEQSMINAVQSLLGVTGLHVSLYSQVPIWASLN